MRASADGSVVVGTSRGGVTIKRGEHWRNVSVADGLAQDEVMDALLDRQRRLWVATESAGVSRIDNGRVVHFTARNGLPSNILYALALDRDDSLWVGTVRAVRALPAAGAGGFADRDRQSTQP